MHYVKRTRNDKFIVLIGFLTVHHCNKMMINPVTYQGSRKRFFDKLVVESLCDHRCPTELFK